MAVSNNDVDLHTEQPPEPEAQRRGWRATLQVVEVGSSELRLSGSLDLLTVEILREAVERLIMRGEVEVTLDAAELLSVDAAGVLLLGGLTQDLDRRGGTLKIRHARQPVAEQLGFIA